MQFFMKGEIAIVGALVGPRPVDQNRGREPTRDALILLVKEREEDPPTHVSFYDLAKAHPETVSKFLVHHFEHADQLHVAAIEAFSWAQQQLDRQHYDVDLATNDLDHLVIEHRKGAPRVKPTSTHQVRHSVIKYGLILPNNASERAAQDAGWKANPHTAAAVDRQTWDGAPAEGD